MNTMLLLLALLVYEHVDSREGIAGIGDEKLTTSQIHFQSGSELLQAALTMKSG